MQRLHTRCRIAHLARLALAAQVPGLYKIFDEIMVNAADNKQRDSSMTKIKVNIEPEEGRITVWNNGTDPCV